MESGGLRANVDKTKVIISRVNSVPVLRRGVWLCTVYKREVDDNSIHGVMV